MAGKGIVIQIQGDGAGAQEALRMIEAKMQETAARATSMQGELADATERVGHQFEGTTTRIWAASGAIREFEGTLPIRAVERFLTETLHLGPALMAAFPVVGGIAFAGMLVHVSEKLWEFGESATVLAQDLGTDWLSAAIDQIIGVGNEIKKLDDSTLKWGHDFDEVIARMKKQAFEDISAQEGPAVGAAFQQNSLQQKILADQQRIADLQKQIDLQRKFISDRNSTGPIKPGDFERSQSLLKAERDAGLSTDQNVAAKEVASALEEVKARQAEISETERQITDIVLAGASKQIEAQQRAANVHAENARRAEQEARHAAQVSAEQDAEDERASNEREKQYLEELKRQGQARLQNAETVNATLLEESKSAASVRMAQLEAEHQTGLISEQEFLQKKLELNEQMLDRERQALTDKQALIRGAITAEGHEDTPRKLELQGQLLQIETQLRELSDARKKDEIETAAAMEQQRQAAVAQFMQEAAARTEAMQKGDEHGQGNKWNADAARESAQMVGGFIDQVSSQAVRGRVNFRSMVDSMIIDIERLAMKVMEERALIPMMNALFGVNSGAGASVLGPQTSSPDLGASGYIPMMAGGGYLNAGDWAVVGDGPNGDMSNAELFAPGGPGTVLPHSVLEGIAAARAGGGGAAPNVSVNVINNSSANVSASPAGVSYDAAARQFVIHTVLEDMNQGGPLSSAMSGFAPK